ncbi:MAG: SAM-dependent methyltransferase [Bacteroidota bacterium]
MEKPPILYLIPSTLGDSGLGPIPDETIRVIRSLEIFVMENGKVGRAFLKQVGLEKPLNEYRYYELNKHTPEEEVAELLKPALEEGLDIGLLSDAGCPGVADPGADLVWHAHRRGVVVRPLVGPSSILLAVMVSGMNGQRFSFQGYLSAKRNQLAKDLKRLERESKSNRATQVWIEAPYRNKGIFDTAIQVLAPTTLFGIACDLTLETELVRTHPIMEWKRIRRPPINKRPTVFTLLARL